MQPTNGTALNFFYDLISPYTVVVTASQDPVV